LPEGDQRKLSLPEAAKENGSEPLVFGGVTLIGINLEQNNEEERLYLCVNADSPEARSCAALAAELISIILEQDKDTSDSAQAIRLILRGEIDNDEIAALATMYKIPADDCRAALYMRASKLSCDQIIARVAPLINTEIDLICDIDNYSVCAALAVEDFENTQPLVDKAHEIRDAFDEAGYEIMIGVSAPAFSVQGLPDAFQEAQRALNLGAMYRAQDDNKVFFYRKMLLERFLNVISPQTAQSFSGDIFNANTNKLFTEEMMRTIEVFFENNLNLSEAARKLYIHRNTLVYRLEKVQKATGIDLRAFDEAVSFRLMTLLSKNTQQRRYR
jgi:carbohydrate diacid regulator